MSLQHELLVGFVMVAMGLCAAPRGWALPEHDEVGREALARLELKEHAMLNWPRQEVSFPLSFAEGRCRGESIILIGPDGRSVPFQLSGVAYHDTERQFVGSARVHFLTDLPAGRNKTFGVYYSARAGDATEPVPTELKISRAGATALELSNGKMAVRVASGGGEYDPPALSMDVPAPIMAVKGPDGAWRGRGYLDTYWRVLGYESRVVGRGPIFAEVETTYRFERGKTYTIRVRLSAEADWAHVEEQMNLGPRCKFVFDCSPGFQPDRMGLLTPGVNMMSRRLNYFQDTRQARLTIFSQYTQLHDFRDGVGAYRSDGAADFLGLFIFNPGQWTRAKVNLIECWERRQKGDDVLTREYLTGFGKTDALPNPNTAGLHGHSVYDGHLTWEFSLYDGRREWGLTITDKAAQFPGGRRTARLRQQVTQVGALPLDRAKDLTLSWAAPPLPQAQAKTGGGRRPVSLVEDFYYGAGWSAINAVVIRRVAPTCNRYVEQRRAGGLSAQDDTLTRARLALLAYILKDRGNYPWDKSMLPVDDPESSEPLFAGMLNQNFHTDIYNAVGSIALALPGHPEEKAWIDHFIRQLEAQLNYHVYPEGGCWEESHSYANHIMGTLLPTLHELRKRGVNLFENERLKKMFDFFVTTVTPFDKNHGSRITAAFGDHGEGRGSRDIYLSAAKGFAPTDPAFARRLMWMYREMGGKDPGPVEPEEQNLGSAYLQGFGAVLRANDARGDETYLVLRTGESWGHHHSDDNSIHLYAKGAPLISDAGKGSPGGGLKYSAPGHSRISLSGLALPGYLGKFHRGWIRKRHFADKVDYLFGYTPFVSEFGPQKDGNPPVLNPIHPGFHDRQVLFVRPDYFLIRDTVSTGVYNEEFWLHFDATEIRRDGNVVTAVSKHGVELDIVFLQGMAGSFQTDTISGRPVATRYIKISQRPNAGFVFLLYPRRAGEPPAKVEPLKDGGTLIGATVTRGDVVDTLFLTHDPIDYKRGDIEFHGCAGLIRVEGGNVTLALPDGQAIRCGDQSLESKQEGAK